MNNRGQTVMLSIVFGMFIFLFGILFINFIRPLVVDAQTALTCSDTTISDGTKLTCLAVDSVLPYFIVLLISVSGGLIFNKVLQ